MPHATDADHIRAARLGAHRVIEPKGFLPQAADKLDASGPVGPHEFELSVETLDLDATSFRNIRERSDGDPRRMAARILEIVVRRGKMHNPETSSGGVLVGTVTAIGEHVSNPPRIGDRIIGLMSLTNTPLRLDEVVEVSPDSAMVRVRGTAYVYDAAPWTLVPTDIPEHHAVAILDIYPAVSYTQELARPGGTVCVLGAGNAGKICCAAAKETVGDDGTVIAVDIDGDALDVLRENGLCDIGVPADLRDPLGAVSAVRAAGGPPADLTIAVTNARGCEAAAILLTADEGQVVFFSMATRFDTASLTPDGVSSAVRMIVGSGYATDRGDYALDLFRRTPALQRAMSHNHK